MPLPVRMPTPMKGKGEILMYIGFIGLGLFLLSLIPPIKLDSFIFGNFEWYLISPKIAYNIRFWFYVFLWIMVQIGIFYIYYIVFKFMKNKVLPFLKRIEDIPSKVQFYFYKR